MIRLLGEEIGVRLKPGTLEFPESVSVQIDGLSEDKRIACEAYAHLGRLKGSQPGKIAKDMLKLLLAERYQEHELRKILCFADRQVVQRLTGRSWLAQFARGFGFEVRVVDLSPETRTAVAEAQIRQRMVNEPSGNS